MWSPNLQKNYFNLVTFRQKLTIQRDGTLQFFGTKGQGENLAKGRDRQKPGRGAGQNGIKQKGTF